MDERLFAFLKEKFINTHYSIKFYSDVNTFVENPTLTGFSGEDNFIDIVDNNLPEKIPYGSIFISNTLVDFTWDKFTIKVLHERIDRYATPDKDMENRDIYIEFHQFMLPIIQMILL